MRKNRIFKEGSPQAELFDEVNGVLEGKDILVALEVFPLFLPLLSLNTCDEDRSAEVLTLVGSCIRALNYGAMMVGKGNIDIEDENHIRIAACVKFLVAVSEKIMGEEGYEEFDQSVH